ncbi:MAG: hypothetical protein DHS20C01_30940 [marine bacterium B5-7]|nr:MAG: hypothetical protein DHS20C01_30940 [marine bacterium B5-7]
MPIYEYVCTECGHELEALQKMSDERLVFCPSCGEDKLKKKISAAAFRLKGSGWYETDFKNNGKKPAPSKEGGGGTGNTDSKSDSSAKSESKSDSSSSKSGSDSTSSSGKSDGGGKGGSSAAA